MILFPINYPVILCNVPDYKQNLSIISPNFLSNYKLKEKKYNNFLNEKYELKEENSFLDKNYQYNNFFSKENSRSYIATIHHIAGIPLEDLNNFNYYNKDYAYFNVNIVIDNYSNDFKFCLENFKDKIFHLMFYYKKELIDNRIFINDNYNNILQEYLYLIRYEETINDKFVNIKEQENDYLKNFPYTLDEDNKFNLTNKKNLYINNLKWVQYIRIAGNLEKFFYINDNSVLIKLNTVGIFNSPKNFFYERIGEYNLYKYIFLNFKDIYSKSAINKIRRYAMDIE